MRGRRTKCSPEIINDFCSEIAKGSTLADACVLADISKQTFYNWVERAEAEKIRVEDRPGRKVRNREAIFVEFLDQLKKAQIRWKQAHIQNIARHATVSWQASAWLLERRYPDEYAKQDRVSHDASGEIRISVVYADDHADIA